MEKINKFSKCPECDTKILKVAKFCPKCGHYVGAGPRSPNEMKALIMKIKRHVPSIDNTVTADWYLAYMTATIAALTWAMGEMDKDALAIATMRINNEKGKK